MRNGRLFLKEYKIFHSEPDNPLLITQEMCDRVSDGLKEKTGKYYRYLLPTGNIMSDVQICRLDYLNSALEILKGCKGYSKHIAEYKNDLESTFFVTVVADVLAGHGVIVEFEPDITGLSKNPDLYAYQEPNGIGVYFECKQPKDEPKKRLNEQRRIFDGIEDVIDNKYSLAIFYNKELSLAEISELREQIIKSFQDDSSIYENRIIVDDKSLGVKLCISGVSKNIEKNSVIEMSGIPNFSDEIGYTSANGINRYGKNIIFYKSASMNTIDGQLRNSCNKVPDGTPYVVCIDISSSRFGFDKCSEHLEKHFKKEIIKASLVYLWWNMDY